MASSVCSTGCTFSFSGDGRAPICWADLDVLGVDSNASRRVFATVTSRVVGRRSGRRSSGAIFGRGDALTTRSGLIVTTSSAPMGLHATLFSLMATSGRKGPIAVSVDAKSRGSTVTCLAMATIMGVRLSGLTTDSRSSLAPFSSHCRLDSAGSSNAGRAGRCRSGSGHVAVFASCVSPGIAHGHVDRPIVCQGSIMTAYVASLSITASAATIGTVVAVLKRPIVFATFGSSPSTILAASEARHGSTVQARQICAQGRRGLVFRPTIQLLSNR